MALLPQENTDHSFVYHWIFTEGEELEKELASAVAKVAEKNGMSANDVSHVYPAILRILKSDSPWIN